MALSGELLRAEELIANGLSLLSGIKTTLDGVPSRSRGSADLGSHTVCAQKMSTCDMPSLDSSQLETPLDTLNESILSVRFPSVRLVGMGEKISVVRQAYSQILRLIQREPLPRATVKHHALELRPENVRIEPGKKASAGSKGGGHPDYFFSDSFYTWIALFQDFFDHRFDLSLKRCTVSH